MVFKQVPHSPPLGMVSLLIVKVNPNSALVIVRLGGDHLASSEV